MEGMSDPITEATKYAWDASRRAHAGAKHRWKDGYYHVKGADGEWHRVGKPEAPKKEDEKGERSHKLARAAAPRRKISKGYHIEASPDGHEWHKAKDVPDAVDKALEKHATVHMDHKYWRRRADRK